MTVPTPRPASTDAELREQIEAYRTWLIDSLDHTGNVVQYRANAVIEDHPEIIAVGHGVTFGKFEALHMLGTLVPPEDQPVNGSADER